MNSNVFCPMPELDPGRLDREHELDPYRPGSKGEGKRL